MPSLRGTTFAGSIRDQMKKMSEDMAALQTDMAGAVIERSQALAKGQDLVKEIREDTAVMEAAFGTNSNGSDAG
jgi:hypothetical protein